MIFYWVTIILYESVDAGLVFIAFCIINLYGHVVILQFPFHNIVTRSHNFILYESKAGLEYIVCIIIVMLLYCKFLPFHNLVTQASHMKMCPLWLFWFGLVHASIGYYIYICKTQIDVQSLIGVQFSNICPFFTFSNRRPITSLMPYFKWRHTR